MNKICEVCETGEATIQTRKIINGRKRELSICDSCSPGVIDDKNLPALSDFFEHVLENVIGDESDEPIKACPGCSLTIENFERTGLLGCDQCYEAFQEELSILLHQIHGHSEHVSSNPSKDLTAT